MTAPFSQAFKNPHLKQNKTKIPCGHENNNNPLKTIPHVTTLLCIVFKAPSLSYLPLRCRGVMITHTLFSPIGKLRLRGEIDRGHTASGGRRAERRIWLRIPGFFQCSAFCLTNQTLSASGLLIFLCVQCMHIAARCPS